MPTINDLRQQAATIKNATQVGENTATRVGTTFETIADLLEGMGGVTNLSTIDIGSIDTLNTTGDMLVGTPNIYTLTKTIGANTFKVGTLFQFANNGRYDVAQVIVSQFIVDADGRIDTTSADQEVHIFYRLCKTMNGGSLPTPIGTWTTWTELGGSGGSGVTIDPYPTQNSGNAVSSGGVFERLQDVAPKVDISAIDDIDEYSDMLATKSPFYVVTKTLSGNVFRIGTLMEFANQGRYILYQILATDYVLNDDGTLDTTLSENGGLKLIWRMKQFSGNPPAGVTIGVWSAWSYLSGDGGYQPDNEDIDLNADDQLQFANKLYDASAFSGLGRVYLRKNIVTSGGVGKNVLTQAMVNTANTIYHIQYDYDLNGQTITLPAGCVLEFDGGSFSNGTLVGDNTEIISAPKKIFSGITFSNFNQRFNARWFVEKVNKSVLDATLYDCSAELNYAFNSGIIAIHFTNEVYYVANTIQVANNVQISGDMKYTYTFTAYNDAQRTNVLQDNTFKGLFTNTGKTIIDYGYSGNLKRSLEISGVNFITDYYSKDDTYDNTIPVVKVKGLALWGFHFKGSITSMCFGAVVRGTGLLMTTQGTGYIADTHIEGGITGFQTCIRTEPLSGWMNGIIIDCGLSGYQGFTGDGDTITANGIFQAAGSVPDNEDGFFETNKRFVLQSLVYDINGGGRVKYAVKRQADNKDYTNLVLQDQDTSQSLLRGIKKDFSFRDYLQNSVFRRCLKNATITSRLFNSDTDEDIPHVLNDMSEFGTLDTDVFAYGANVSMNDGNDLSQDILDFVTLDISIVTSNNELQIRNFITYLTYLYSTSRNAQIFKYFSIEIKNTNNEVLLSKSNVELTNNYGYTYDVLQYKLYFYASVKYTINIRLSGLTKVTPVAYIGAIGIHNLMGNAPDVSNINVFKNAAVNQITPLDSSDKSIFYAPAMSKTMESFNIKTLYLGTLKFTKLNIQEAAFLRGVISRNTILYTSPFEIYAYKAANADATFKVWSHMASDNTDNQLELKYELTTTSTEKIYDLYLSFRQPAGLSYVSITELRQMAYNSVTFEMLYPNNHAPAGTPTLIGYLGTSGNSGMSNNVLNSQNYAAGTLWHDKSTMRTYEYMGDVLGWRDVHDGVSPSVKRSGTFAQKPASADIYVGFRYWCTNKQTTEGATDGIEIFHKGSDVWVDALGRVVS